ncbi:MAG TPA: RnfABCDGE type electron transport complex subunit B [Methylothermaceae bacterium]|nr:RnfABCDGE type electron transport complex subunit B [Methylothermaceae bacterium]
MTTKFARVALIDESRCIGCARCLEACPVDAIVGARNLMHTVIAAECIGCELCLPPCPVNCIEMVPTPESVMPKSKAEIQARGQLAKARHRARQARLQREAQRRRAKLAARKAALLQGKTA